MNEIYRALATCGQSISLQHPEWGWKCSSKLEGNTITFSFEPYEILVRREQ